MNTLVKIVVFLVLLNLAIGLLVWTIKKLFFFGLAAAVVYFIYKRFLMDKQPDRYQV